MAQGKEFTEEQRQIILESIQPYLELGYSLNKACILAEVEPSTVYKWLEKDEALSKKVASWRNMVSAVAVKNIVDTIKGNEEAGIKPDIENSKWWLSKKEKETFGNNIDVTSNGEAFKTNEIVFVDFSEEKKEENETES